MSRTESMDRGIIVTLLAVGVALGASFVYFGVPPGASDDSWFKGPAAHLAMTGQLASPGLTGVLPRVQEVYASYPPLPQYVLAACYAIFGLTRRTSIGYDMAIHVLGAVAIGATALRLTRGFELGARVAWWSALGAGLVWLAGHRMLDRQEHFGLLFVWLDVALVGTYGRSPVARAAVSGLFAGLASMAAPWAGVLGGGLVAGRALAAAWDAAEGTGFQRGARAGLRALVVVAAGAATTCAVFGAWVLAIELRHPGIFDAQFLGAMRATTEFESASGSMLALFRRNLLVEATLVPALVLAALWFPVALRELPVAEGEAARASRQLAVVLHAVGLSALLVAAIWRPTTYFYLWAAAALVMPGLALVLARFSRAGDLGGRVVALGIVVVAWLAVPQTAYWTLREDPRGRLDGSFEAIRALVPPGVCVAVTTTHWMAFQGRNPWRDVVWQYKRDPALLAGCDWMVLNTGVGRDLPVAVLGDFQLVEQLETEVPIQVTHAWAVYRRVK